MIKFSFLVSIYNGEKYLSKLFDSLLEQDISYDQYEIVCVDDCSQDNSIHIVEKYQNKFANIKLFKNSQNQRVATNLNNLIAQCRGIYFWPVGQDDYIAPNCLGKLWNNLYSNSLDVILFNYRRVTEKEEVIDEPHVFDEHAMMSGVNLLKKQFANTNYCHYILGYEWRAVYNTQFWCEKQIACVNGMNYEDTIIMLKAIVMSNRVAAIPDILYNYRLNDGSITFNANHIKKGEYIYEFAFDVGQEEESFYPDLLKIDVGLADQFKQEIERRYNNFAFDLIRTSIEQKRIFYKFVKENRQLILNKKSWLNYKSKILLSPMGFPLSVLLKKIYRTKKLLF